MSSRISPPRVKQLSLGKRRRLCSPQAISRCKLRRDLCSHYLNGYPFDSPMVLLHNVVEIFNFTDGDSRAVFRIIALDGRCMGRTPVNGDRLRHAVAANRLRQKPLGGLLVTVRGEEKVDRLARFIDGVIEIAPLALDLDVDLVYSNRVIILLTPVAT